METVIIEEISRNHKLIGRHKYTQTQINIGRGYNNDIVLTDFHICPQHLQITFDGEHWLVNDLESVNGSFLDEKKPLSAQHVIQSGDVITIGNSKIRIIFPDHPVPASIVFSPFENLINLVRKPPILIANLLVFTLLSGYLFFLNKDVESELIEFLAPALGMSLSFALWPLGVALVSHFTKNEPRVWSQVGISFAFFNLFWLTDYLETILLFNTSSNIANGLLTLVLPVMVAYSLFWLNSYIGFDTSTKRRHIISASLIVLFLGGNVLVKISNKQKFSSFPNYDSTLLPPKLLFSTPSTVDNFLNDAGKLFPEAQKAAQDK